MHVDEIIRRTVLYMLARYNIIRRPWQKFGTYSILEPINTFQRTAIYPQFSSVTEHEERSLSSQQRCNVQFYLF